MHEGLPGPWLPADRARPLRSWSQAQKQSVQRRLAEVHRDWCIDWIPTCGARREVAEGPDAEVTVTEPDTNGERSTADGEAIATVQGSIARWSFSPRSAMPPDKDRAASRIRGLSASEPAHLSIEAIAECMFALATAGSALANEEKASAGAVASAVARAAWAAWLQRISLALADFPLEAQRTGEASGASIVIAGGGRDGPWSGTLRASWPWCEGVWHLLLPHGAVAALLLDEPAAPRPAPLPRAAIPPQQLRLDQALAGNSLTLNVVLSGALLSLEQLQELRPGDIVPLEHALAMPAQLLTADGAPVCDAWLGQSKGHIAIELAAVPAPLETSRI